MTNLKQMRLAAGLSQTELARRMGCYNTTVWTQEQRGIHMLHSARRYAAVLHCSPETLLEPESVARQSTTRIGVLLATRSMTPADLAKACQVPYGIAFNACRSGVKTLKAAKQFAVALDCSPDELLEAGAIAPTRLGRIRQERELTLTQIAARLHVAVEAVRQQELKGICRVEIARKYATVLRCKPQELLEERLPKPPKPPKPPRTKLEKARREAGLTRQELAVKAGASYMLCAHAERKGVKTVRLAKRYAAVLNCSPLDIIEL